MKPTPNSSSEPGPLLVFGAHPDDERTPVLAYFARGRLLRTAYLSATRGEGGQNLIGSEQGAQMGIIRTQELLDARRIDGAEQFFTRAIDFGFTKTASETLEKWGRERLLSDMVWVIRRYRPDVVILCFTGTSRCFPHPLARGAETAPSERSADAGLLLPVASALVDTATHSK